MAAGGSGGNAGAIRAGKAFVELAMKDTGLQLGLKRAAALVANFGAAFVKVGAVGAGGLAAAAGGLALLGKSAGDRAVDFDRLSKRVGVPIDQLSAFAYAAGKTGEEIGNLEGHFENFAERVYQASQGTGEAAETFKKLGLNARDLIKMNPAEQMIAVADAMSKITNNTERRGILSALGSDQFQGLNDLFSMGSDGIRKLMSEAKDIGAVLDPAETKDAAAAMGELNRAWTAGKNAAMSLGSAILPTAANAKKFADFSIFAIGQAKEWVSTSAELVKSMLAVDSSVGGIVGHFATLGEGISSALSKGDAKTAFQLFLGEIELLFRTFTANLAALWKEWAGPFIDTFKDAKTVIKGEIADLEAFAKKQLLGTETGNAIGRFAAAATNRFGQGLENLKLPGAESVKEFAAHGRGGFEQAAALGPDAVKKMFELERVAERNKIIAERAAQMEVDRLTREKMLAEQQAKLDAIRAKQAENLKKAFEASNDFELGTSDDFKKASTAMADFSKMARGGFGISNFRSFFGTGGNSIEQRQLKEQEEIKKATVAQTELLAQIRKAIENGAGAQFQ
jgi:hypothetical protein